MSAVSQGRFATPAAIAGGIRKLGPNKILVHEVQAIHPRFCISRIEAREAGGKKGQGIEFSN